MKERKGVTWPLYVVAVIILVLIVVGSGGVLLAKGRAAAKNQTNESYSCKLVKQISPSFAKMAGICGEEMGPSEYRGERQDKIYDCPYTIDESGTYFIDNDLPDFSDDCITITADDVTLNGNNHLIGPGETGRANDGIFVKDVGDNSNIIIKNLKVEETSNGVIIRSTSDVTVKNVTARSSLNGIQFSWADNNLIEKNKLVQNNYGVNLANSDNNEVKSNTVCNNNIEPIYDGGSGNTGSNTCDEDRSGMSVDCGEGDCGEVGPGAQGIYGCQLIDSPGTYKLMSTIDYDPNSGDYCFIIKSSDVIFNGSKAGGYELTGEDSLDRAIKIITPTPGGGGDTVSNITIKNFKISDFGVGIEVDATPDKASDITIKNNELTSMELYGIYFNDVSFHDSNSEISGNRVCGSGTSDIHLYTEGASGSNTCDDLSGNTGKNSVTCDSC